MTEETRARIENAAAFAANLCMYAGEDQAFYDAFWRRLLAHPDILSEFVYYREHESFSCKKKVSGKTVVDIMIWQIDHFKAHLDRDPQMRCNKDKMVLYAFDTMTKMAEKPELFEGKMEGETGTDFVGKYN